VLCRITSSILNRERRCWSIGDRCLDPNKISGDFPPLSEIQYVLDYTVPFQKSPPSFILYHSISEVHSVFYIIPFHFRSPLHLLYYMVPFQKSTPSFILYGSISEVHFVFYIIWFHFRSPFHLLYYTNPFQKVPFQKSTPSFILY
jgi:hypothetical protein